MTANPIIVILPSGVETWISGVSRVEIEADKTVSLSYENHSRVTAKLEHLTFAVQENFFALVRSVQNASRATGQRILCARIS